MQWAQGYSGCGGVDPKGDQEGSRGGEGFEVRSALRIAGMGRQKLCAYLASKTAMKASLVAMETRAKSRAQSDRSIFFCSATCCTSEKYDLGPVRNQKRPISVCSC